MRVEGAAGLVLLKGGRAKGSNLVEKQSNDKEQNVFSLEAVFYPIWISIIASNYRADILANPPLTTPPFQEGRVGLGDHIGKKGRQCKSLV